MICSIFVKMILGMKVRKHDVMDMLKFNPKILEFHFSDSDLNLKLDSTFDQELIVHCYEYFDRKIVDLVSLGETNQIHSKETSIELVQKAIDKTIQLGENFEGTPSIIVNDINQNKRSDLFHYNILPNPQILKRYCCSIYLRKTIHKEAYSQGEN